MARKFHKYSLTPGYLINVRPIDVILLSYSTSHFLAKPIFLQVVNTSIDSFSFKTSKGERETHFLNSPITSKTPHKNQK